MSRLFPYPLLVVSLVITWLMLAGFSLNQFLLGLITALIAALGLAALSPVKPRFRRWDLLPKLFAIVFYDIVRSNIAVAGIILHGGKRIGKSSFMAIPLDLRDPTGLAILAVIITSTPGTAWIDYNSTRSILILHIFDLVDKTAWLNLIKNRYEYLLREIFE
ncbi:Na+/H+ antiporter subunit E [Nitrosomonas eutropha]|uniref:Multisubunit potassium/proton antiporter PhaE subunit n=2 Tax=Nitrosomonas eutropha TaxID=916 RepID=A0ABX5MAM5_9PROT|nr:Na+/H+ antiporter subunit E [Nitrosomonas eutropha]ABI59941.1 multisubunit potassium/proton antiporter, PhaE subunit [Nitrosomonas eutropha C91]PXV81604.1 multisubunit potassium/proton antiporter PhaE subunit [Nitrosomonas eutropha]SCX22722.1 multisubunit potassium/proton antiporter, PhaE subunit [Nitrosomonas eutropha]SEJ09910.1 multisubunit potassium/proton antiporter, PhaE subunit [Nitrosomonas eutropha]